MPIGCEGSTVHLCEACDRLRSKGSTAIVVKMCLRMANLLEYSCVVILRRAPFCPPKAHPERRRQGTGRVAPCGALFATRCWCVWLASLLIRPPEADITRRRPHLQHGTASVQLALRGKRLRTPLAAFAGDVDIRKVRSNVVPIAQVHAGTHRDRHIGSDINRNVPRGSFKHGIAGWRSGLYQLHDDAARSGLNPRRWNPVQFNPAAACVSLHMALSRSEVDAASAGLNLSRPTNVSQVDAAPAGFRLHLACALFHLNSAAAGLDARALRGRNNLDAASTGFRNDLPVGVMHLNRAPAGMQANIASDGSHINGSAARFRVRAPANVIQVHAAAAALCLHAPGDAGGVNVATLSFDLHQVNLARHINGELS